MRSTSWPRRLLALVALAVRLEVRMYVGLVRLLTRRRDVPPGADPLPYVGAVSVLLWAITAVSTVELVVLHVIIPWERVRLAADVIGIWGVVWALGFTACHYVYPHLATAEELRVRTARRMPLTVVPWSTVRGVSMRERSITEGKEVQVDGDALLVGTGRRVNVSVQLSTGLAVEVRDQVHEVREVWLYVDEPREVVRRLRAMAAGGGRPAS